MNKNAIWYSCGALTLKVPITTAADDILNFFFLIIQRKQVLVFHVNCVPSRHFTWNIKTCFLWKIKKIKINVVCYKFCLALYGLMVEHGSTIFIRQCVAPDKGHYEKTSFVILHWNVICTLCLAIDSIVTITSLVPFIWSSAMFDHIGGSGRGFIDFWLMALFFNDYWFLVWNSSDHRFLWCRL